MTHRICSVISLRAEIIPFCVRPGGKMSTVISFPRVRRRTETPSRAMGASAIIVILPVVRIKRALEPPSGVKAKAAKSVAKAPRKTPRAHRLLPARLAHQKCKM
jgi:hypothetical protein